ncbi:MAG TPA: hypothetical protein VGH33_01415, partial [Isosphaeraceae bacterium]
MPGITPPRRAPIILLAALACASRGTARGQSPISAVGQGVLKTLSPNEGESFGVEIQMRNGTNGPVRVARAEVFLACQGGWLASLGETIAKEGKFFGNPPVLGPGEYSYEFAYRYSTPISHYVLALQLAPPGRPPLDDLLQVPIVRPRFPAPPKLQASAPVFVGLQEPIEVFTLADGVTWLAIVGQVVNTSGKPLTLKKWHLFVKDGSGKAVLDRDLTAAYHIQASKESLNEFFFGFILPKEFRKGTLQIDAEVDLGGRRVPVTRPADVERVEARAIRSPVEGRWSWGNGPGELRFHTHYHFPEQRNAYDLGIRGGAGRGTSSGDPNKNESYFCWDRPIRCV